MVPGGYGEASGAQGRNSYGEELGGSEGAAGIIELYWGVSDVYKAGGEKKPQVPGQTYEEYMKENIFEVCGMQNSTNTEVGNITSVPANGGEYMAAARGSRGAGDIHSNVCDILLWERALMSQQIINSEQLQHITTMLEEYFK